MEVEYVISEIIQSAYEVHWALPPGYLEPVYQRAMEVELSLRGIPYISQYPLKVVYKGICIGEYRPDILVDNKVIVELKAVEAVLPIHEVQTVNYLQITGLDNGLLINFGSDRIDIRRKFRLYHKPKD